MSDLIDVVNDEASGASVTFDVNEFVAFSNEASANEAMKQEKEQAEWRDFLYRRRESIADLYSLYDRPVVCKTWDEAMDYSVEYPERYQLWKDFKATLKEMFEDDKEERRKKQEDESRNRTKFVYTLTTNLMPNQIQQDMCEAVFKLMTQKTNSVRQGYAYLEYTFEGRPHIHGWYETDSGGRIYAKTFKRCWQYWGETKGKKGFPGGYHDVMKSRQYDNYAADEGRLLFAQEINKPYKYNARLETHFPPPPRSEENAQDPKEEGTSSKT